MARSPAPRPPATPTGRQATTDELRRAVGGREHEFVGIALIVGGAVIGLALYFDLAGPLGRGLELLLGWVVGIGRLVIPVALVVAGVSLVRKGQSSNPTRLVIGWGLAGSRSTPSPTSSTVRSASRTGMPCTTAAGRWARPSARRWRPPCHRRVAPWC